ncbi:MAG: ABC transporter ATP-binding protein [Chloroflexi bacterium]|nr:ABC transporter ATP-binding protein [Chloroflexota bacterium]
MNTRQTLWRLMRYRLGPYLLAWFLHIPRSVVILIPGLITREYFNRLAGVPQTSLGVWQLIGMLVLVTLGRLVVNSSSDALNVTIYNYASALMRKNIFSHILRRPGAQALFFSPGELVSRLEGDVEVLGSYLWDTGWSLGSIALGLAGIAVMMSIQPLVALVVVLPMLIVISGTILASARIEAYRKATRASAGQVSSFIGETFGAVQAIQVATAEIPVIDHFRRLNAARRKAALQERLFGVVVQSFANNSGDLGTAALLLLLGGVFRSGNLTPGDYALFIYAIFMVTNLPYAGSSLVSGYKQVNASLERLNSLVADGPADTLVRPGPVYLRGALPAVIYHAKTAQDRLEHLVVTGLSYRYPGAHRGISDISLRLERGSFTVITGRIGCGKTTLVRTLLGLLPQEAGEIRWNGQMVADPATFFVPPRCAYTPQVPRLFSETLQENILLGLPQEVADLPAAIHAAVMEQDVETLENGLATPIGPKGVKLSGGQIQRAAAARMFIRDAELLVFDDLSSALDVQTERILWQRLFERREVTSLVVSHRHAALRHADHVIVLKDGQVEAEGTLEELLENCAEMQRLWKGEL